jgi:cytochrome c-type biogenesis protein CcmE
MPPPVLTTATLFIGKHKSENSNLDKKMSESLSPLPETSAPVDGQVNANRGKLLIALVVLVGALGYFGFMAFEGATVYYYTVGEIQDIGPTPQGKAVRVSGKLMPETFHRPEGSTIAEFALTDGDAQLLAMHQGVLPDLFFNEHSEIILEGTYGPDGVFASENVIVKCPSKYVAIEDELS